MTTHRQAKAIVDALPGITPETSLLTRAVAFADSHYDNDNSHHNWGNVTAGPNWDGDTFEHEDSRWDEDSGKVIHYSTQFRSFRTSQEGAANLWNVLRYDYRNVVDAVRRGDWWDVPRELREARYYLGNKPKAAAIRDYTKLFTGVLATITSATGEKNPMRSRAGSAVSWVATLVLGSIATAALGRMVRCG